MGASPVLAKIRTNTKNHQNINRENDRCEGQWTNTKCYGRFLDSDGIFFFHIYWTTLYICLQVGWVDFAIGARNEFA